jgi:hypothetical protein
MQMGWYSFIEGARHDGASAAAVTLAPAGGDRRVAMMDAYRLYRAGQSGLGPMAYYCLTHLEAAAGGKQSQRRAAASKKFKVAKRVLDALATLSTERGGRMARKVPVAHPREN